MEPREFKDPDTKDRFRILSGDTLRLQRFEGIESGWLDVAPSRYALVLLRALARRPEREFESAPVVTANETVFEVESVV